MPVLEHVSHSQINQWLRCPRQWFYRYVKGLKIPPSGALVEGSCYHKALEVNFKQKITSLKDMPVDLCLDAFSDAWNTRVSDEEFVDWVDRSPGFYKSQGITLVEEYMNSTSPSVQPAKVEEAALGEVAGVKFICFPDLVDVKKIVIDHKTSSRAYSQDDVDKSLQASAEAFALGRPIAFENHVAVKAKVPRIQIVRSFRLRADIEWWEDLAVQVVTHMKTGIAPPNPDGWHCSPKFCGFWEICRGELTRTYG